MHMASHYTPLPGELTGRVGVDASSQDPQGAQGQAQCSDSHLPPHVSMLRACSGSDAQLSEAKHPSGGELQGPERCLNCFLCSSHGRSGACSAP